MAMGMIILPGVPSVIRVSPDGFQAVGVESLSPNRALGHRRYEHYPLDRGLHGIFRDTRAVDRCMVLSRDPIPSAEADVVLAVDCRYKI